MIAQDFKQRVRLYVEDSFSPTEGWVIEEKKVEAEVNYLLMRKGGAIAIARIVDEGSISKDLVQELSALRDMNQAYLAIIYRSSRVPVQPEAASVATRIGVSVIEVP